MGKRICSRFFKVGEEPIADESSTTRQVGFWSLSFCAMFFFFLSFFLAQKACLCVAVTPLRSDRASSDPVRAWAEEEATVTRVFRVYLGLDTYKKVVRLLKKGVLNLSGGGAA